MTQNNARSVGAVIFALGGLVFSGYLSFEKLFAGSCAFDSTCPTFIGYPACYFGFAMFFVLAALSFALVASETGKLMIARFIAWISTAGALFALYFSLYEIPVFLSGGSVMRMPPSCVIGLFFYLGALYFSVRIARGARTNL